MAYGARPMIFNNIFGLKWDTLTRREGNKDRVGWRKEVRRGNLCGYNNYVSMYPFSNL